MDAFGLGDDEYIARKPESFTVESAYVGTLGPRENCRCHQGAGIAKLSLFTNHGRGSTDFCRKNRAA